MWSWTPSQGIKIHPDVLSLQLKLYFSRNANLPTVGDANSNPLQIQHELNLRISLEDALYRVPFLVAERLSCPVSRRKQVKKYTSEIYLVHSWMPAAHPGRSLHYYDGTEAV